MSSSWDMNFNGELHKASHRTPKRESTFFNVSFHWNQIKHPKKNHPKIFMDSLSFLLLLFACFKYSIWLRKIIIMSPLQDNISQNSIFCLSPKCYFQEISKPIQSEYCSLMGKKTIFPAQRYRNICIRIRSK